MSTLGKHLTESQLAHAVAAMKPYEERKARERIEAGKGSDGSGGRGNSKTLAPIGAGVSDVGRVTEKLAEKAGVGGSPALAIITPSTNCEPASNGHTNPRRGVCFSGLTCAGFAGSLHTRAPTPRL